MLRFSDFSHLPVVDDLLRQLLAEPAGLILVAGPDSRPPPPNASPIEHFLPSGRAAIFRILIGEWLDAHPQARCVVIAEDRDAVQAARRFRQRIESVQVKPPLTYAEAVLGVSLPRGGLLVVDRLTVDNLREVLTVARRGGRVMSQIDSIYYGRDLARRLLELGATAEDLAGLRWTLAVQRLPLLCPDCRIALAAGQEHLTRLTALQRRLEVIAPLVDLDPAGGAATGPYYAAGTCPACHGYGRQGDVAVFDFFRADSPVPALLDQPSRLPMEAYVLYLAQQGRLALNDALYFEADQMRRAYNLMLAGEQRLAEANRALEAKVAELEAANRVLQQRTRELFSLEDMGQAMSRSSELEILAARACQRAGELTGADRVILYFRPTPDDVEVLAVRGWDAGLLHQRFPAGALPDDLLSAEPIPYPGAPPGAPPESARLIRAGLAVPLVAQNEHVGLMVIQATRKARFLPRELALVQAFASQAAVAIQRGGLIQKLQAKIEQLEAAQAGLAQKERMERELELARQVQQRMLPHAFPQLPGLRFAAHYAPARQVGGDFYDVIRLDDDRVAVVIADVSDKGLPAALFMALTRSLILAEARRAASPREVLGNVNRLLVELNQGDMFVTVFYGLIERDRCRLVYARAGHDRPFLLRGAAAQVLQGEGIPLGLFDDDIFRLSQEEVALQTGDRLIFYTDGMTDVVNPDGHILERGRWQELLLAHATRPAEQLCVALFAELAAYQRHAPQFDDMALVVVDFERVDFERDDAP